jgi:membrane-associated phospholipid phosphatase
MASKATAGFWPVDILVLSYFLGLGVLVLFYWGRIHEAGWAVTLELTALLLPLLASRMTAQESERRAWFLRHWYPFVVLAAGYKEMGLLIPAVRRTTADAALARWDFALWGVNPIVWLERLQSPALKEFLQLAYSLFLPAVLLVAALLWWRKRWGEFRYYVFLVALGFLISFLGYLLVPARGPRFLLDHLQSRPLEGLWTFSFLRGAMDWLEGVHYDCFPSGHTALTLLAWWSSRRISRAWFWAYSAYTLCMIFSTVYLRYHYTIDPIAGAVLGLALLVAAPRIYGERQGYEQG